MKKRSRDSRGKKSKGVILVTGSAGRIGAALVERLGKDYEIVGFELMKALYASSNEELVPMDISSDESVAQAFRHIKAFYGKKIAAVVHLAAYYSFEDQNYKKYKKITVEGTRRLLDALQGFDVGQFIFSSTMLVHKPSEDPIKESSPQAGSWSYPKSKIETEEVIKKHRKKIPSVILRISGVYDDMCHSIPISNQIQRIYENQFASHLFPGNMDHGASFMHMDDLIDVLCLCIQKRRSLPKLTTLLIGEDETMSTTALQNTIGKLVRGKKVFTWRIPKFLAWIGSWVQCHMPFMSKPFIRPWMIKLADDNYALNLTKARKVLGWKPKHKLSKDLSVMIKNMKKNPEAWYRENGLKPSPHLEKLWHREKPQQKRKR